MIHRNPLPPIMFLAVLISASCTPRQATPIANTPNPASVYCEENGGELELRQTVSGGVAGICVFPDGAECDEWAFFRGTCKRGDSLITPEQPPGSGAPPAGDSQSPSDDWETYRDERLGFSFRYPSGASIAPNDEPLSGLSIVGPLVGDDHWPMLSVSHPANRAEYRPPEGADLAAWLTEHNLLGAQRLPDVQIGGTTAIHTRQDRSPQSYAFDSYYFAHSGQLYSIIILHTGDKEDWSVYSQFLESIQFDR